MCESCGALNLILLKVKLSALFCDIYLNGCAVAMVDKVKYLGVYFERKSGQCDISQVFIRFYSQFNNIIAVMGKNSNEITTLHLVKTYCLPTLLFGCEIWNLCDRSMHKLNVAWNNFRYISRFLERKCKVTAVFADLYRCRI